jgi:transcriptional activator for dhaKLM operon
MQPSAYPVAHEQLAQLWRSFMNGGRLPGAGAPAHDPAVIQSWRRCVIRLDPESAPRPARAREQAFASMLKAQTNLIAVATPFMEDIHQFMEGGGCAVLLAEGTGCLLAAVGDAAAVASLEAAGLGAGTYWAEGQLGTNAIGLALTEAMPAQVVGAEHFFRAHHRLTTAAAPIHDVRGRIVGLIGIVGPADGSTPQSLALVMAAARAVSNQLQTEWYVAEANLHLSEVKTILETISEGVIAWDDAGKITHMNAQAGEILGTNPAAMVGRSLAETLEMPPIVLEAMTAGADLREVEIAFQVGGRLVNCLTSLRPVGHSSAQPAAHLIMLRPIQAVRQLVQQQIGATAALTLDDLTSESIQMRRVLRQARIAARGEAPVLLRGQGGVGKNHLARAIHNDGRRAHGPFLAIDCRAIPHELMAGEFLGYQESAAREGRPSKFELANGGTLLLDQIESLSLEMQTVLLRVLETGYLMRLGGTIPVALDTRIMGATTANLEQRVAEGSFISHLYYRFGVFDIDVPPLAQRREDVPLLTERFLARISQRDDRPYWVDGQALEALARYPWPGNVRELESALERAVSHCREGVVRVLDLPEVVRTGRVVSGESPQPLPVLSVAEAEREAIIRAGQACHGRVGAMAEQLGIGRTTLWRKMKRLQIRPEAFR